MLLLLALLFVWVPGAPKNSPPLSTSDRKVAHIRFELNGNHIYIRARINSSQLLWFVLDTGADHSVINLKRTRELGLKTGEATRATGAGGSVESAQVHDVTFDLGPVQLSNLSVATFPLESIEATSGHPMDVILGSEFFGKFVVEIDYETQILTLYDPAEFEYRGAGTSLPLTFFDNHPYVRATITPSGRKPIEGEFVIDLGSNFALTLLPSFIAANNIMQTIPKTIVSRGRGVGGEVTVSIGRIQSLQLDKFRLDSPITMLPANGTFAREGKAGNIGSAILRRFRVIFDYSHKRMILEPNKFYSDPLDYDMSGIALTARPPDFRNISVLRVIASSPATDAGILPNDEIIAVNGRPVSAIGLTPLRELFKRDGQTYSLSINRGGQTLELKLKTRRLI